MREFPIVYGNKQSSHLVRGVAASYGEMRSETPQPGGRFLDDEDVGCAAASPSSAARSSASCSAAIPPVGETIRIAGQPFEIIGVMEEKVQMSNYNRPGQVLRLHSRGRR